MKDVSIGWLIRYIHANGALLFFTVTYAYFISSLKILKQTLISLYFSSDYEVVGIFLQTKLLSFLY